MNVDPRVGRALLALEAKRCAHHACGCLVKVRAGRDDGRILAAQFDYARLDVGLAELLVKIETDIVATGESHAIHIRIIHDGVPDDATDVIVGLSTDDDVRRRAEARRYDAVLIDGDHSLEGVTADYEWARDLLAPGGFLLIDDYRGPSWPDVTKFVDEVIAKDDRFEMVGAFGDVSFSLAVGEVGIADYNPESSPFGWHIVKRLE